MTKVLLVLNDPPYGTERSYNGLRLAGSLAKRDGVDVRAFFVGDAVGCAATGQKVPDGHSSSAQCAAATALNAGR